MNQEKHSREGALRLPIPVLMTGAPYLARFSRDVDTTAIDRNLVFPMDP
jgi:hypothetical protein